ncbi:MAG: hypothetical protein IJC43_03855, partial [Clostridia bacterium]|nr:hypothetical protein [Clostridia bacterium]
YTAVGAEANIVDGGYSDQGNTLEIKSSFFSVFLCIIPQGEAENDRRIVAFVSGVDRAGELCYSIFNI